MMGALRYLGARFKRALRYYPAVLVFALITALLIVSLAAEFFVREEAESEENKTKVSIGVVGDLEDTYLDLAVFALQNMDSSRYYAEMVTMSESEAEKKLENGKIIGYVIVPEGYVETVMSGENEQLTYVVKDSPASLVTILMNEVVETVSHYVTLSENGIYGYTNFCREMDIPRSVYRPKADVLSIDYLQQILDRESVTETEYVKGVKGLDLKDYYVSAVLVLMVMLWGISFAPMMLKGDTALYKLLAFRRTGAVSQILGDLIVFFSLMAANVLLLMIGAEVALGGKDVGIAAFENAGFLSAVFLFVKLLPCVLLLCAMQFLLYELSGSVISAVLMQLFVTVASGLASGFFFPQNALPESVAAFGRVLPSGVAFEYITDIFSGADAAESLLFVLLMSAGLVALSLLLRIKKIRSAE